MSALEQPYTDIYDQPKQMFVASRSLLLAALLKPFYADCSRSGHIIHSLLLSIRIDHEHIEYQLPLPSAVIALHI